ncbi:hypothetical protein LguiB_013135 [Lonicera macranthoides]
MSSLRLLSNKLIAPRNQLSSAILLRSQNLHTIISFSLVHLEQSFHVWEGHDVVAIACPERYVVGLDISDSAIKTAIEREHCRFFWAIEPDMRSAWASRIQRSFKASYEEVLQLIGFKAISIVENELAIGPRKILVRKYLSTTRRVFKACFSD